MTISYILIVPCLKRISAIPAGLFPRTATVIIGPQRRSRCASAPERLPDVWTRRYPRTTITVLQEYRQGADASAPPRIPRRLSLVPARSFISSFLGKEIWKRTICRAIGDPARSFNTAHYFACKEVGAKGTLCGIQHRNSESAALTDKVRKQAEAFSSAAAIRHRIRHHHLHFRKFLSDKLKRSSYPREPFP